MRRRRQRLECHSHGRGTPGAPEPGRGRNGRGRKDPLLEASGWGQRPATLVTASWPPELGEKDLVMFKQPSVWPLVKAAPGDKVSLRTGPTVPAAGLAFHTSSRDVFTTTNLLTRGGRHGGPPSVWGSRSVRARSSSARAPLGATAGHSGAPGDRHVAAWSRPRKAGPAGSSGGGGQEALCICPPDQPLKQGLSVWAPRGRFGWHDLGCEWPERERPGRPLNTNANSAKVGHTCLKQRAPPSGATECSGL